MVHVLHMVGGCVGGPPKAFGSVFGFHKISRVPYKTLDVEEWPPFWQLHHLRHAHAIVVRYVHQPWALRYQRYSSRNAGFIGNVSRSVAFKKEEKEERGYLDVRRNIYIYIYL